MSRILVRVLLGALVAGLLVPTPAQAAPPVNDNFVSPQLISGATGNTDGSNVEATFEDEEPQHAGVNVGATVWFTWTAPATAKFRFDTTGSLIDTVLAAYTGTELNSLTHVASNDNEGPFPGSSSITIEATTGTVYKIALGGRSPGTPQQAETGHYELNWAQAPPNDDQADAEVISGASGNVSGTLEAASKDEGQLGGPDVWYRWTAPATGATTFYFSDSDVYPLVNVIQGPFDFSANPYGLIEDTGLGFKRIFVNNGEEYLIRVSNTVATGTFTLAWKADQPNDLLANATSIAGASGTTSGNNLGADGQGWSTCPVGGPTTLETQAGLQAGSSIWFKWTAPATSGFVFDTEGSDLPTRLGIFTRPDPGSCPHYVEEQASSNNIAPGNDFSRVRLDATSGTEYFIAIDGDPISPGSGGIFAGDVTLNWYAPPANDDFADASTISNSTGTTSVTNAGATKEGSEPQHGNNAGGTSVWFEWTAPSTAAMSFNTTGSSFDTLLGVYQETSPGSGVTSLLTRGTNDDAGTTDSRVGFNATSGQTYFIAVDGKRRSPLDNSNQDGFTGDIVLNWLPSPANDDFAAATDLGGVDPDPDPASGSAPGNNEGATKESLNEQDHGPADIDSSIWYRWTAPSTGRAMFEAVGQDFKAVVAVYSGTALNNLSSIGAEQWTFYSNWDPHPTLGYRVFASVTQGTEYFIAVDSSPDDPSGTGPTTLTWAMDSVAPSATIDSGPTNPSGSSTPQFDFTSDDSEAEFYCRLDGGSVEFCQSPTQVFVAPGGHTLYVFAVDSFGNVSPVDEWTWTRVDASGDLTPPTVSMNAMPVFQKRKAFMTRWSGSDAQTAVANYDLRRGVSGAASTLAAQVLLLDDTTTTQLATTGAFGSTYCFSVKAKDLNNNESAFSPTRCTAVPLNNTNLAHKGKWVKKKGTGYFANTFSETKAKGASLKTKTVRAKRIALVATKCKGCGTVAVMLGKKVLKKVSLASTKTRKLQIITIANLSSLKSGVITIKVLTGKPVRIEGLGISKS